uniref:Uncharacterized protein n=1 Tax=Ditylenchus dipsaci TaxID=166011 RepID=A0A915E3H9_9BILA
MLILIGFAFLVVCKDLSATSALDCWSCQGKCDCRGGLSQTCPSLYYSTCYTIRNGDGHVIQKGCSSEDCSLDIINPYNQNCNLCRGDLCNQEQGLVSMDSVDEDDCPPLNPSLNPGSAIADVRNNYRASSARTAGLETHLNSNNARNTERETSNMVDSSRSNMGNPSAHYGPSPMVVGKIQLNVPSNPGHSPKSPGNLLSSS